MSEYIKDKNDMKFKSTDELKRAIQVIDETGLALKDKTRNIDDSTISESIASALGVGLGSGIGFAGLYFGGVTGLSAAGITSGLAAAGSLVGGGMAVGIGVLAAPAFILGGIGYKLASNAKFKKLIEAKEIAYTQAIAKQTAIIKALREESTADKKRIEYLTGLNILLQEIINDLKHDLGKS